MGESDWPKGREPAYAIAELANALTTAIGWMPHMSADELERCGRDLSIASAALADIMWARGESVAEQGGEVVHLFPQCEAPADGEGGRCPNRASARIRWSRARPPGRGQVYACASCAPKVRANVTAFGLGKLEP
jgi:hypothetical protein